MLIRLWARRGWRLCSSVSSRGSADCSADWAPLHWKLWQKDGDFMRRPYLLIENTVGFISIHIIYLLMKYAEDQSWPTSFVRTSRFAGFFSNRRAWMSRRCQWTCTRLGNLTTHQSSVMVKNRFLRSCLQIGGKRGPPASASLENPTSYWDRVRPSAQRPGRSRQHVFSRMKETNTVTYPLVN